MACEADLANARQNGKFPSVQHLGATGARARARHVFGQIQQGEGEMPVFPEASQNVATTYKHLATTPLRINK